MSRLTLSLISFLAFLISTTSSYAESEEKDLKFFRIGAGPTSGTLYALSTAISASISRPPGSLPCDTLGGVCGVPGLIAVAQSKSGSIENLNEIRAGEVDSALVRADVANQAFAGTGPFFHIGANPNLRVIADMFPVNVHVIVRADSDIHSVSDLTGKLVSIGADGSGTRALARALLQAYGYDMHNIRYRYLRPGPAADRMMAGSLDAIIVIGAAPIPAIKSLAGNTELRFLSLESNARRDLQKIYAHLNESTIDKSVYDTEEDIATVSIDVQWVVDVTADVDLVEDITQALWQSETETFFLRNNPEHHFPEKESALPKGVIPPHLGSVNYYKAAGLL